MAHRLCKIEIALSIQSISKEVHGCAARRVKTYGIPVKLRILPPDIRSENGPFQLDTLGPLAMSRILSLRLIHAMHALTSIIQTEAERRRREAGVKQSMEIRLGSCMYVGMWVCMVFGIISRTKARSTTNEIPKCRSPVRALLRHSIIGVRLLTSARRAKLPK